MSNRKPSTTLAAPRRLTCGCCTNGCVCSIHEDIPRGLPAHHCELHRGMAGLALCAQTWADRHLFAQPTPCQQQQGRPDPEYKTYGAPLPDWARLNEQNCESIRDLESENRDLVAVLRDLCNDIDQLEGSGPFVISSDFCQVNRERARALLAQLEA